MTKINNKLPGTKLFYIKARYDEKVNKTVDHDDDFCHVIKIYVINSCAQ